MTKLLFLILILSTSLAYSFCKLNIRGDNICLNESALYITHLYDNSTTSHLATIKKIEYPNITIDIKSSNQKLIVHIDDLAGNLTCEESTSVCKKQKVKIDKKCIKDEENREYEIENIYSNEMIEIKVGFPMLKKSLIIPVLCIINLESYLN